MALSRRKIAKEVQKAMTTLGDVPLSVTYVACVTGAYDPETNAIAVTETTYPDTRAVNTTLSRAEADWFPVERHTQKLLIAALDLPVTPSTEDNVIIDGVTWSVKRTKAVPGGSLHIIFIQEP